MNFGVVGRVHVVRDYSSRVALDLRSSYMNNTMKQRIGMIEKTMYDVPNSFPWVPCVYFSQFLTATISVFHAKHG